MKLNYDIPAVPKHKAGMFIEIIREFLASGKDAAELVLDEGADIARMHNGLYIACKRAGGVKVKRRYGKLYLIREDA